MINLNAEKFSEFMKCLSVLKDTCTDIDINGGFVRQRTNTYSCMFEIDLNPLIGNINLPIACLKQKLDILKTFNKCDVEISVDERSFSFADSLSKIKFDNPRPKFMDNKFISREEYDTMIQLNPEDLIMECKLGKVITDRVKIISQAFNADNIQIVLKDNKASIISSSRSKDQEAKFMKDIEINKDLDCRANIVIVPLIIDHDGDINLKIYETENDACLCLFETKIGDVDISVLTKSPLLEDDF